jgi:DNA-binding MarR family transcriptional regulator
VARSELRKRYFEEEELSIKSLLSSSLCSDRAVRLKIREMENKGYLYSEFSNNDKRIVVLKPTVKLLELIDEHALIFLNAVTKDHHLIEK